MYYFKEFEVGQSPNRDLWIHRVHLSGIVRKTNWIKYIISSGLMVYCEFKNCTRNLSENMRVRTTNVRPPARASFSRAGE